MFPAGFEPAIPASDRPQAFALDRSATGMWIKQAFQKQIVLLLGWFFFVSLCPSQTALFLCRVALSVFTDTRVI